MIGVLVPGTEAHLRDALADLAVSAKQNVCCADIGNFINAQAQLNRAIDALRNVCPDADALGRLEKAAAQLRRAYQDHGAASACKTLADARMLASEGAHAIFGDGADAA